MDNKKVEEIINQYDYVWNVPVDNQLHVRFTKRLPIEVCLQLLEAGGTTRNMYEFRFFFEGQIEATGTLENFEVRKWGGSAYVNLDEQGMRRLYSQPVGSQCCDNYDARIEYGEKLQKQMALKAEKLILSGKCGWVHGVSSDGYDFMVALAPNDYFINDGQTVKVDPKDIHNCYGESSKS